MAYYYTVRTKRRRLKKSRLLFLLAIFAFLLLLFFASRFLGALKAIRDESSWAQNLPAPEEGQAMHVLLYTISPEEVLTSLSLAAVQKENKIVRHLALPVETLLNPGGEVPVNMVQVFASTGRPGLVQAVERLLQTQINVFMEISEDALSKLVSRLEKDNTGIPSFAVENLPAYLNAGGLNAQEKTERRRLVLAAVLRQTLQGNMVKDFFNFRHAASALQTNLSWREVLALLRSFEGVSYEEAVQVYPLPGTVVNKEGAQYWVLDMESIPALSGWLADGTIILPRSRITVEVLNGCGVAGLAGMVASMLESEGFNVVNVGNAANFDYEVTQVICRTDNLQAAKEVALIIPNAQLLREERADSDVLVTVIIGKNYHSGENQQSGE
ncbi:MAG: LCP family protein [Firmicutes bacterium]|nr:LCP family protein [Bacillota bacterium]